jgi:hypothetical protein
MRTSPLIRSLVLTLFVLLLASFVVYRSGAFDKFFNNANASSVGQSALDTIPAKDTGKQKQIMSGSKSLMPSQDYEYIISDGKPKKKKKQKNVTIDSTFKTPTIMSSSKSGPVIVPKSDTQRVMMPSSKSGPVFTPRKDTAKKQQQR